MVNLILRIAAQRVAHRTAAVEAVDPSTPTKTPRCSDWSGISFSMRSSGTSASQGSAPTNATKGLMHYADHIRGLAARWARRLVPGTRGHSALSSTASPAS
jgi:hypothetical protein